jgi:hypothetical protein
MRSKLACFLVTAMTGSGCSLASVYGPAPSNQPRIMVSCTDERYAPALDFAATGVALGDAIVTDSKGVRGLAIVAALGYGASMVYGYMTTKDCMEAKNAAYRYHTHLLQKQYDVLDEFTAQGTPSEAPAGAPPLAAPPPQAAPAPAAPPPDVIPPLAPPAAPPAQ